MECNKSEDVKSKKCNDDKKTIQNITDADLINEDMEHWRFAQKYR